MGGFRTSAADWSRGVVSRSYFWLFALLLDPLDAYNRFKPDAWPRYDVSLTAFFGVLAAMVLLTSFLTYHDLHKRAGTTAPRRRNLVPLHKALHWIARDSVWAERYEGDDSQWVVALGRVFQRALSLGEVTAFGYRELHHWVLEGGLTELQPGFWTNADLDISHVAAFHAPRSARNGGESFDFLEVDFDEVKAAFPRRSKMATRERVSPVERIGNYDQLWATQEANYRTALANARLTPAERIYKNARQHG